MPYMAGGIGIGALENKLVGSNLPPALKNVNLGIGATTGALFSMPSPEAKMLALSSLPIKESLLFGIGGLDKFRQSQQDLTNTNLNTAKTNQSAAQLNLRNVGSNRAVQLAFLIPALVGAGALGYEAYDKFKKTHKPESKFKNMAESGTKTRSQKLKLEMPMSALPPDFASAMLGAQARSHMVVKEKDEDSAGNIVRPQFRKKADVGSTLQNAGQIALDFTGVPNLLRGAKDIMHGYGSLNDSDYGNTARYMGAGLGNLAIGTAAARWGAYPIARLIGKARLQGVIRSALKGESKQLTDFPASAKYLYRHGFLHDADIKPRFSYIDTHLPSMDPRYNVPQATGRMLAPSAFDSSRYAWNNPTTKSTIFNKLFTAPGAASGPRSLLDTMGLGASYMGNRAVNAGYGVRQLARRYPNAALTVMGSPFANRGTIQDEDQAARQKALWDKYLPQSGNTGPMGMPVSSIANSVIRAMSGTSEPIARQLSGM